MVFALRSTVQTDLLRRRTEAETQARLERIRRAWDAFDGTLPKPLPATDKGEDDDTNINYAAEIVEIGAAFLFGDNITFEITTDREGDPGALSDAEQWLAQVWDTNDKPLFLQNLALSGAIAGHAYVKIQLDGTDALPRLLSLDASTVTVGYDPSDISRVDWYRIEWEEVTEDPYGQTELEAWQRQQIIERDGTRWTIVDRRRNPDRSGWETLDETVWPYEWPPVVDCQNLPRPHEYWGRSDLEEHVIDTAQAARFLISNLRRIVRYHGHPKTVAKGIRMKELDVSVDGIIGLPSGDADLFNLEMQSDLASSLALYRAVKEGLHETSRTPLAAVGTVENVGQLSGRALRILFMPLLQKTEAKRRSYGHLLETLCRRLLEVAGRGTHQVRVVWPELLPTDPLEDGQALLIDKQLGASRDTLLSKRGYDPVLEAEKTEAEGAELADAALRAFDAGNDEVGGAGAT